jgi:hypothetical protein
MDSKNVLNYFVLTILCLSYNSYLCNELGKVIFFRTRCGIFNRDEVKIKNASSTEKTLFLLEFGKLQHCNTNLS